jgi:hypothetical protein
MTNKAFEQLQQATSAFQESCLLSAAAELDFFTLILEHGNEISAIELAKISDSNAHAASVLLNALAGLGYLVKRYLDDGDCVNEKNVVKCEHSVEAVYSVADEFKELLDSCSSETYIPMIRHLSCVQRSWTELARTIKTGNLTVSSPSILGAEQDEISYIMAMNSLAVRFAAVSIEDLRRADLLKFRNFIDIGGASGTYSLAFLQAVPECCGTLFNLPVGIEAAKPRFIGSEYEGRIKLIAGDFMRDELPNGFDFAWVSAVIHQFNEKENLLLYKKTYNTLEFGGVIAIRDFVMNGDKTAPIGGLLFEVTMLAELNAGAVYSFGEIKSALKSVGFKNVEFTVQTETMSSIVTAKK